MISFKFIHLRTCIPEKRSFLKIICGKPHISFIRIFACISEFQFQSMIHSPYFIRFYHHFGYNVISFKSFGCIIFVSLETIRLITQIFHHISKMFPVTSDSCMRFKRILTSIRNVCFAGKVVRNRSRYQINGSSRSERAVLYLTTPFQYLNSFHSGNIWKIISRRSRIRSRCRQYTVLHNRDTLTSLGLRSSQTNVRTKPETVFFIHINSRNGFQHAVDIRISKLANFLGRDIICRACTVSCFKLASKYLLG